MADSVHSGVPKHVFHHYTTSRHVKDKETDSGRSLLITTELISANADVSRRLETYYFAYIDELTVRSSFHSLKISILPGNVAWRGIFVPPDAESLKRRDSLPTVHVFAT